MAGYGSMKMKRKEVDEVSDDFSDFSLSSPATKIRRLDAELPPIPEEGESEIPVALEQSGGASIMEESVHVPPNEERAIVLFNPWNAPLLRSPSDLSVCVDSHFVSGFKNFWSNHPNCLRPVEDEEATEDKDSIATKENLAVVPWVPSQGPQPLSMETNPGMEPEMDSEEMGATSMDIESNESSAAPTHISGFGGLRGAEGLPQWQQLHCMTPQLPQNASTPIIWFP